MGEGRTARGGPEGASVADALAWLERRGTRKNVEAMARYGVTAPRAFGVTVGETKAYAKSLGRDHDLALALWASGWYEARLLAAFVDDPERVTARQMDAWASDFDNWAIVDTTCFHLFDRTRHAWTKARRWATAQPELKKRAAFALMWALSVHDREASDDDFRALLPLIEAGARDARHFVKKAVDMALRAIGKRSAALNAAAIEAADRLAAADDSTARWVGRHARAELTSLSVRERLARARRRK